MPAERQEKAGGSPVNRHETSDHLYRRRLLRKSRTRRVGGGPPLRNPPEGDFRRGGRHHQQPHGTHRGDRRPLPAEGTLYCGTLLRLQVCHRRLGEGLGPGLEKAGLGEKRQETRPEPRPVAAAAGAGGPTPAPLPLGEGPRGEPRKQPLRPDGGGGE